jgi:nucleoside transporter
MASGQAGTSAAPAPPLRFGVRLNLSWMMFLEYAIWGSWFTVLSNYCEAMGFGNAEIGQIVGTMALASIFSPIFIGQIADRYFSSERLLAALHLAGAVLMYWWAQITDATMFYWVALLYSLVYAPTIALTNSVAFSHSPDATRDFPGVRVLGTIGWIIAGLLITVLLGAFANAPADAPAAKFSVMLGTTRFTFPLLLGAILSVVLAGWSLFLPHTPPAGKVGDAFPFLKAVGLMREPSFAVFYGVSFIITIVLAFYYSFTGLYLAKAQAVPDENVSSWMVIGQFAEMILLPFLPFFLARIGMKWVLALGMLAWGIRYAIFSIGQPWVLIVFAIALHGVCFDFFFAAGFIHVDNKSPASIRASAQSLFVFLTYGVGMWLGSVLSGILAAALEDPQTKAVDWTKFWIVPSLGVLVSLIIFVALFHDRGTVKEPVLVEEPAPA